MHPELNRSVNTHRHSVAGKALHADGEPIPGEVQARLTRARATQRLFQVVAQDRRSGRIVQLGPAMVYQAADLLFNAVDAMVRAGRDKTLTRPTLVELIPET